MNGIPVTYTDRPIWQIIVKFQFDNGTGVKPSRFFSIFYFYPTVATTSRDATNLRNAFLTMVSTEWNDVLPAATTIIGCTVRDITSPLNAPVDLTFNLTPNVALTAINASNEAVYIYKKTALRGKEFRGSWHLGPVAEAHVVDQLLTAGAITKYSDLMTKFDTNIAPTGGVVSTPVLLSTSLCDLTANPAVIELNPFAVSLRQNTGTMRRRQRVAKY